MISITKKIRDLEVNTMSQQNELVTLDPRGGSTHENTGIAPRPDSLDGLVIGLYCQITSQIRSCCCATSPAC